MTKNTQTAGTKKAALASVLTLAIATPFIAKWEGLKTETYRDVVGIPTVCYGQTGADIKMGMQFSEAECAAMLDKEVLAYAQQLDKCVQADLTPYQNAAILELGYNVGVPAVCRSTMVRMINAGAKPEEWCPQLNRWVKANGRSYQGLINRRADSYRMCMK